MTALPPAATTLLDGSILAHRVGQERVRRGSGSGIVVKPGVLDVPHIERGYRGRRQHRLHVAVIEEVVVPPPVALRLDVAVPEHGRIVVGVLRVGHDDGGGRVIDLGDTHRRELTGDTEAGGHRLRATEIVGRVIEAAAGDVGVREPDGIYASISRVPIERILTVIVGAFEDSGALDVAVNAVLPGEVGAATLAGMKPPIRELFIRILRVLYECQPDLLQVALAARAAGVLLTFWKTGKRIAARIAIMAMATSSSISVKPNRRGVGGKHKMSDL